MTIPVHTPSDPYIDHEALATEQAFREFALSREYAPWAKRQRLKWESTSEHAKAMRERQRKEGKR